MAVIDVLRPEQHEWLAIGGFDVTFRVSGADTDGAYSVVEYRLEPGRLVPPHTHTREQELSYVLRGEIGLRVGADEFSVKEGCFALKPAGIPHCLWNPTGSTARALDIISPAGFEPYFRELAGLYASGGPPDLELLADLRNRYGILGDPGWTPELKARLGLKMLGE
jgi:quercetin dioxygenase-like cupin family protein